MLEERSGGFQKINIEIKDIVFDYFNIITKEYEIAYDKYKDNKEYADKLKEIKEKVEEDFVNNKFKVPNTLSSELTKSIMDKKKEFLNECLMKMIQGGGGISSQGLTGEVMKFDD